MAPKIAALRELDFGNDFITLTKLAVEDVTLHEAWKTIEDLDIFCSVDYAGGFSLAVDAELIIGGLAGLAIKVNHFSGKGRVQFARKPYTHWSFAFYEEPRVIITVESSIQGQNFPQIANIITGQIRRVLRSKHTLPSYRIKFKPFFLVPELRTSPPQQEKVSMGGTLEITVVECSRFVLCEGSFQLYCMLSVEDSQWINLDKVVGTPWIPIELEVVKTKTQPLGVEFKQGDVVLSVKDHDVTDAKEAFRLLSKAGEKITMRIERKSEFKWGQKQERQQPIEATQRVTSNANDDSSRSKTGLFTSRTSLANLLGGATKTKKIGDSEDIFNKAKQKGFPIKRTTYVLSTREPVFLETFEFEIKNNYKYINVGIWSKGQIISMRGTKKPRQDTMLAYASRAPRTCRHLGG
ncbi:hypothetical protein IscW_ISCW008391 [Ixodes scapularis]|uniref:PDZD8 N-terminal domain-containing protein n=1 Tax=Ixodes scapularis TaxID=6945 RepID=B7PUU0_IXOSC|nr:hypothetical protein IscW_ISCW008391 [Ixodes scapularis]|eukprot:XP_002406798.1 hypothetical protein IscW_ISCW008391 [Ixodes scapularis]